MSELILEGSRASRSISMEEINSIAAAKTEKDVESLWGRIADWFFGTHKEEAKKMLFRLLNPSISDKECVNAFNKLKELVSEPYKDRFIERNSNITKEGRFTAEISLQVQGTEVFSRSLDVEGQDFLLGDEQIKSQISNALEARIKEDQANCIHTNEPKDPFKQFKKDINRMSYQIINGGVVEYSTAAPGLEGVSTEQRNNDMSRLLQFAQESGLTDNQNKTLEVVLTQTGIIEGKNALATYRPDLAFVGNPDVSGISLSINGDGALSVEWEMSQNHTIDSFNIYKNMLDSKAQQPNLSFQVSILVDIDGKISCEKACAVGNPLIH
ncbi:hypothetical protein [Chitinimonas sp. BJB300]|uniref:hypothetical protein n=1 Tax=Chitinimonas sp. BJB300 TaxID=1559339 RepID=UPI000C0CEDB8|nr:hypothetical protein [Chitinimonas sp. BJB300]PHV12406.1 hypothetical protein CSQ89_05820 [Chitinimonas sp. BJB300]TSJ89002.1 hypothetical protein FG002_008940 [Chitinimonas sp. BJB300]